MTISITKSRDNLGPAQSSSTAGTSTARATMLQFNNAVQDIQNILTALRNFSFGNAGFAINSNFDIKNGNAVEVFVSGVGKPLAASTNFDTGTAQVITADKWSSALLTYDGTATHVRWSATLNAASEAAAIAALPTRTVGETPLGYVTVQTGSGVTWTAGTDALAGGTGGTPATTTNYYNDPTLNGAYQFLQSPTANQVGNMNGVVITA